MDPVQSPDHQRTGAAQQAPRCQHIRFNGQPCAAPALRGQDHCHFHKRLHDPHIWEKPSFSFIEDASSLQFVLMQVIHALVTNDLDPKRCALLLYSLQIACANLKNFMAEHPKPELAEGEQPQPRIVRSSKEEKSSKNGDEPSLAELMGMPAKGGDEAEPPRIRSREDYSAAVEQRDGAGAAQPGEEQPE